MLLQELHSRLKQHLKDQEQMYDSFIYAKENGFYQGFDKIKIDGCRNTEKRFKIYNIKDFLSKDRFALDIGSNCGFFSLYISEYLKGIDGLEINPFLVKISNDTKEFLKNKNSFFFTSSFENFISNRKYDLVFSLANDETVDGNTKFTFSQYIDKIRMLLKSKGILIFEGQALSVKENHLPKEKKEYLKKHFDLIVDKMVESDYPIHVKERPFLILRKKD